MAEGRYEKFCSEELANLPSAFALQPKNEWGGRLPVLPLQRQLLHITIFDSICWNFRPLLLLEPSHVLNLPTYKQVLLCTQKKSLAVAALNVLEAVSALHGMLGASHTRYPGIIFHTFESAILLACLCMDSDFPASGCDGPPRAVIIDPLAAGVANLTRERCIQAAHDALSRLQMLAEVNNMADAGARTLTRLLDKLEGASAVAQGNRVSTSLQSWSSDNDAVSWPAFEHLDSSFWGELLSGELLSATGSVDSDPSSESLNMGFDHLSSGAAE
ncbi:MAG: hypothetical protein Q9211_001037 [Gyalolechia sp. 1 TL-2023]